MVLEFKNFSRISAKPFDIRLVRTFGSMRPFFFVLRESTADGIKAEDQYLEGSQVSGNVGFMHSLSCNGTKTYS